MSLVCRIFFCACLGLFAVSCDQGGTIFPTASVTTDEATVELSGPIDLAVDAASARVYVANSNIDYLASEGTLAVLSVDATDPAAPVIAAESLVAVPNYATNIEWDGANTLYVNYRESAATDTARDVIQSYTIAADTLTLANEATVSDDPYGMVLSGGELYSVSDDVLEIFDAALTLSVTVDLTAADDAGVDDSNASAALDVAVDAVRGLVFVSNQGGSVLIVDLATDAVVATIAGPLASRDVLVDTDRLYVLDHNQEAVWVFDLTALAVADGVAAIDDSTFVVGTIPVGNGPLGLALDTTENRLYVANSTDDTVSVIDTVALIETARVSLHEDDLADSFLRSCDEPVALKVATIGATDYVFAACLTSRAVFVINADTLQPATVFPNTEL